MGYVLDKQRGEEEGYERESKYGRIFVNRKDIDDSAIRERIARALLVLGTTSQISNQLYQYGKS